LHPEPTHDGLVLATEDLEQAGLACAVPADQPHLVTGSNRQACAIDHDAPAYLDLQVPGLEHASMMVRDGRVW
jgi:hypothetical protein